MRHNSSENPARKLLLQLVASKMATVVAILVFMTVSAAAAAGYAWLAGPLIGSLEGGLDPESASLSGLQSASLPGLSWTEIAWLLVLLGVLRAVSETGRAHLTSKLQLGVVREFRGEILSRVLALDPLTLGRWPHGELASRVQVEVHGVRTLLQLGVNQGIRSILMATALAIVALKVDASLATPGLLVVPLAVAVIVLAARPARKLQRQVFAAESSVVSDTAEAIAGAAVLRAYGASNRTWDRIDRGAGVSELRGVAAATWSAGAAPLVELVGAVAVALVFLLAWSSREAIDLASAGTVLVALVLMFRPLHGLAQAIFGCWSGLASLDRLNELLELPARPREPAAPRRERISSLRIDRVSFAYGEQPVLDALSAVFRAGELVALKGASGAGKSTLLGLLAGLVSPSGGQIWIDAAPAAAEDLGGASAWMPQSPTLFHDTVLANVALGAPQAERERVIDLCRMVDAHELVVTRPGGYDAVLREGGADLSMGQRQRLTLARALYREAPVLLLDEPTSALDEELERRVLALCCAYAERGAIVIVATHREDFLNHADRVLELRDGGIVEWDRPEAHARLH